MGGPNPYKQTNYNQKQKKKRLELCSSGKVPYESFTSARFFQKQHLPNGKVYLCKECNKYHMTCQSFKR